MYIPAIVGHEILTKLAIISSHPHPRSYLGQVQKALIMYRTRVTSRARAAATMTAHEEDLIDCLEFCISKMSQFDSVREFLALQVTGATKRDMLVCHLTRACCIYQTWQLPYICSPTNLRQLGAPHCVFSALVKPTSLRIGPWSGPLRSCGTSAWPDRASKNPGCTTGGVQKLSRTKRENKDQL